MRKYAITYVMVLVLLIMSIGGCATTPAPKTMPQSLTYSYGLIEGMSDTVKNLYLADVLSKEEAHDAYDVLQKAWSTLERIEVISKAGKDLKTAAELKDSLAMLETLRSFLIERSRRQ